MKVGSAPGARPGRGEAGQRESGIGSWLGCGGWGSGISQFFSPSCPYGWARPFLFPAGVSLALPPMNCISSLGAVSPEVDRTSGTQLTGEGKTACTGLCSVGEL